MESKWLSPDTVGASFSTLDLSFSITLLAIHYPHFLIGELGIGIGHSQSSPYLVPLFPSSFRNELPSEHRCSAPPGTEEVCDWVGKSNSRVQD